MSGSQSSFSQFSSLSGFQELHFVCNSIWLQAFKQLIIDWETLFVSKLLRTAIQRDCAVWLESEQTPFLGHVVDLDLQLCKD